MELSRDRDTVMLASSKLEAGLTKRLRSPRVDRDGDRRRRGNRFESRRGDRRGGARGRSPMPIRASPPRFGGRRGRVSPPPPRRRSPMPRRRSRSPRGRCAFYTFSLFFCYFLLLFFISVFRCALFLCVFCLCSVVLCGVVCGSVAVVADADEGFSAEVRGAKGARFAAVEAWFADAEAPQPQPAWTVRLRLCVVDLVV